MLREIGSGRLMKCFPQLVPEEVKLKDGLASYAGLPATGCTGKMILQW